MLPREEAERLAAEARERAKAERRCPECNNKVGMRVMVAMRVMIAKTNRYTRLGNLAWSHSVF